MLSVYILILANLCNKANCFISEPTTASKIPTTCTVKLQFVMYYHVTSSPSVIVPTLLNCQRKQLLLVSSSLVDILVQNPLAKALIMSKSYMYIWGNVPQTLLIFGPS